MQSVLNTYMKALLPEKATAWQKMKLKITPGAHSGICSLCVKRTTLEAALSSVGRGGKEKEKHCKYHLA